MRMQGIYLIPEWQGKLCKVFRGPVLCPACGEQTVPQQDLRLECICGALWTYTLGVTLGGAVFVTKMERFK